MVSSKSIFSIFSLSAFALLSAHAADTISFNFASQSGTGFGDAAHSIGPSDPAGADIYNTINWNNLRTDYSGNSGAVPSPIVDSNGNAVSGMAIWYDTANSYNNGISPSSGDSKLMRNYLDSGSNDSPSVQLTNLPYRKFDLVAYADGDGGLGQTLGPYVIRYGTSVNQRASQSESATTLGKLLRAPVWLKEVGNFSGTYTLVDTATSLSVRFRRLSREII